MSGPRQIAVLGSTGSIGTHTLDIVDKYPGRFRVVALGAGRNVTVLREQVKKYRPEMVAVLDPSAARELEREFPGCRVAFGETGLSECASAAGVELVVMGIAGFAALAPTLEAIRAGKTLALASKEVLVVAGSLLRKEIAANGCTCIPVDSEHNALFQLLEKTERSHVRSLVLTASGGPLFRMSDLPLEDVTPAMAVNHPNWKMGAKISVDSATLMNKALEVVEAHFLFQFPQHLIEVWIHPQSILHGALWLHDNSCLAQLTKPDMRSSIGFALNYPERLDEVIPKLTLREMARLEFYPPDEKRFPALRLARQALKSGPGALVVLNAANEVAVRKFLEGRLLFPRITQVVEAALEQVSPGPADSVEQIFEEDRKARLLASSLANKYGVT